MAGEVAVTVVVGTVVLVMSIVAALVASGSKVVTAVVFVGSVEICLVREVAYRGLG